MIYIHTNINHQNMAADLPKPKLLLPMLTLLLLLLSNYMKKVDSQDTTSFQIDTFKSNPSDLIYQGGAHVPPGSSYLSLVRTDSSGVPQQASAGRVLYSPPVNFWEPGRQATFETTIRFKISPSASSGQAADGLAFFIAPVNTTIPSGSTGGHLGIYDPSDRPTSLFAVEFDVYANQWDPSYNHVGININSRTSVNITRFEGLGQVVTARINYNSNTKKITVATNYGSKTSTLSYVYDLKNALPQQVRVGISASTGLSAAYVANFDVFSWYFTSTLVYTANNDDNVNGGAFIK
ncbi:agglutinin-2-like [Henckelia pumila]|uniref:agglutinin-2-like n=1 Tax=Henckelia pumila TaxID=405737 RepID=UPI003C6E546F